LLGYVTGHGKGAAADRSIRLGKAHGVAREKDDLRARRLKFLCGSQTDATARPGDDHHSIVETVHPFYLPSEHPRHAHERALRFAA
jgi:hypothetical protein